MKIELKRQLYAWLLLSVFVPMMAVAALHVHDDYSDAQTTCAECVHHQAHHGHLSGATGHLHDCVLCQLLNVSFLVASFVLLHILTAIHRSGNACPVEFVRTYAGGVFGSRAPPVDK